jgi:moderate conductance mechanosensitive channel
MTAAWRRARALVLVGVLMAVAGVASAQAPPPPPPPSAATVEIERLIATIQDDAARERLLGELRALLEAQRRVAPPPAAAEPAPVHETVTSRLLEWLSDQLTALTRAGSAIVELVTDAPEIGARIGSELADPDRRLRIVQIAGVLAAVLLVSWLAEWLARRALRRVHTHLEASAREGGWTRLPLFVVAWLLSLVPLVAFGGAAYVILAGLGADSAAGLAVAALVNAYLLARAVNLTAAAILSPGSAVLRVLPITDETAAYIHLWVRRFANISIYVYFVAQAAVAAGLPLTVHDFMLRVLGLVNAMLLVTLILQSRVAVARRITGSATTTSDVARSVTSATGLRLRRRLAGFWHVLAIIYVLIALIVWLIRPADGGIFVLNATALTALTWVGAILVAFLVRFVVESIFRATDNLRQQFPSLKPRANQYLRLVALSCAFVIYGTAFLITLQIWGARSLDWFTTPVGRRLTGSAIVIAISLAIALLLWELGNVMFERWVARPANGTLSIDRREARVRTLMPIMQLALMVVLALFVGFIVLSEIGISIAPLLASAGAIGIAVGLGAQGMIKNLITGVSMILSDTLAVGDVVTLVDKSGVVEGISISAVQLRSFEGTLHTIPFGNITVVSNQTKDFAYAAFDIGVGYDADIDRAGTIIAQVGRDLRRDETMGQLILADLELFGVDAFADRAVIIKARMMTLPGRQWDVARAFNRRLKQAFDQAGIDMPLGRQNVRVISPSPAGGEAAAAAQAAK